MSKLVELESYKIQNMKNLINLDQIERITYNRIGGYSNPPFWRLTILLSSTNSIVKDFNSELECQMVYAKLKKLLGGINEELQELLKGGYYEWCLNGLKLKMAILSI